MRIHSLHLQFTSIRDAIDQQMNFNSMDRLTYLFTLFHTRINIAPHRSFFSPKRFISAIYLLKTAVSDIEKRNIRWFNQGANTSRNISVIERATSPRCLFWSLNSFSAILRTALIISDSCQRMEDLEKAVFITVWTPGRWNLSIGKGFQASVFDKSSVF